MLMIKQAVLHILDKNAGNLLLSDNLMNLEDGYVQDYINRLVVKINQSDIKTEALTVDASIYSMLMSEERSFIEISRDLAQKIFSIISPAEHIPAADYLFFEAMDELEEKYFGIIRLDYQSFYTHFLEIEEGARNQLIQNHSILPNPSTKPTEAFVFNRSTMNYQLLEKKYEIEGEKQFYFSEKILGINPPEASPTHIKKIRKTVQSVAKRYDELPYEAMAKAQQTIYEQLDESNEIDAMIVIEKVFESNMGAMKAAQNEFIEQALPEKIVVTNVPKYEKKYSKQKFKLKNGIEITIPIELYGNEEIVEFINEPDGSVSVMIKNAETMMSKFNG